MSRQPVLVTGGAGFIGRHLVRQLVTQGYPVRVLDPNAAGAGFGPEVEAVPGSVLDRDTVARLAAGAGSIFHLAANTQLWTPQKSSYEQVNVEGTRVVLDEAARAGVGQIVVTSTEAILRGWRNSSETVVTEAEPTPHLEDMAGDYCRSKFLSDQAARQAARDGLPVVIVYPTVPIGPGDRNMTAPTQMIADLLNGRLPGYLDLLINLVAVEDVAWGHILAAERGRSGDRFILGHENLRLGEVMAIVAGIAGCRAPNLRVPYWAAVASAATMELVADVLTHRRPMAPLAGVQLAKHDRPIDSGKARRELGWHPGTIPDALARAVDWLNRNGIAEPAEKPDHRSRATGSGP